MGRFTVVALLLAQLIAISVACSSGGGSVPRSNSGRPFDVDLSHNTDIYPYYNSQYGTFGVGLEHRPNENTRLGVGVGVDRYGNPRANVGFRIRFGRSIENQTLHDIDISMELFKVLDINGDDQLDVKEWFDDGGKIRPFSDLIGDHDSNSDEMISLEEFLAIPVDPALIAVIDQILRSDQNQNQ